MMKKTYTSQKKIKAKKTLYKSILATLFCLEANQLFSYQQPAQAQTDAYCRLSPEAIATKENL
ncbi:MAG: hypothetical protein F6K24_04785, partial [Okeania sp. SIO2D1]|nr:hypothetical protein [Okeania sp. SIO2D1]